MGATTDPTLKAIYNAQQLAVKVSLNSVYGTLGRASGNLALKPLGQLTTYIGRTLIMQTKDYTENVFEQYIKDNNLVTHTLGEYPRLHQTLESLSAKGLTDDAVLDMFKV